MQTKISNEILLSNNETFYKEYFELFINRLTHSSMSLEPDLGNVDDVKNAVRLKDNMEALKYLLESIYLGETITSKLITDVASIINRSSPYISNDYRKIGKILNETNIPISNPENIKNDIDNLLYKYFNEWKDIDSFEREARFHIEFIRIHPFEEPNGVRYFFYL